MKIKKYIARTFQEGKNLILEELGDEAVILSSRTTPLDINGESNIEIIAGINESSDSNDDKTENTQNTNKQSGDIDNSNNFNSYNTNNNLSKSNEKINNNLSKPNFTKRDNPDFLTRLENFTRPLSSIINKNESQNNVKSKESKFNNELNNNEFNNNKFNNSNSSSEQNSISKIDLSFITSTNSDLSEIKKSIKTLENNSKYRFSSLFSSTHLRLYKELLDADFEESYVLELISLSTQNIHRILQANIQKNIFDLISKTQSNSQTDSSIEYTNLSNKSSKPNLFVDVNDYNILKNEIKHLIIEDITFAKNLETSDKQQRLIFVGPSGSGKTSALIKLAIITKLIYNAKILIIAADSYKVGGLEQLQTLSSIANLPFKSAMSNTELQRVLLDAKDYDFVFIDTSGRSPKDESYLKEIKDFINISQPTNTFLVQNSTINLKTFKKVLKDFNIFKSTNLILTKIDETESIGSILSILKESNLPLNYITNGQQIPDDIEPATKELILDLIFRVSEDNNK